MALVTWGLAGRLAWAIGFGARVLITDEVSEILGPRMKPTGSDSGNSGSGSWRQYLDLSSDTEENRTPGPQAPPLPIESGTVPPANAVTLFEAGPSQSEAGGPLRLSPSSPSSPSPSWFEGADNYLKKRFGDQGEVSSSAPCGVSYILNKRIPALLTVYDMTC